MSRNLASQQLGHRQSTTSAAIAGLLTLKASETSYSNIVADQLLVKHGPAEGTTLAYVCHILITPEWQNPGKKARQAQAGGAKHGRLHAEQSQLLQSLPRSVLQETFRRSSLKGSGISASSAAVNSGPHAVQADALHMPCSSKQPQGHDQCFGKRHLSAACCTIFKIKSRTPAVPGAVHSRDAASKTDVFRLDSAEATYDV